MAALLGLRLAISVASVLDISVHLIVFWSDSLNVLWWIRGRGRIFEPFIGNRVGEIQTYTNPDQWRYVPTKENPADLVSRGQSVTDLRNSHLWWHGPTYLDKSETEWPENRVERSLSAEFEVRKSALGALSETIVTYSMFAENIDPSFRLKPDRFSSWTRLKRVYAWVCRFIDNCRLPSSKRNSGELLPEEISDVEVKLIQKAQRDTFPDEYRALSNSKELPKHSKLLALKPRIDTDGLMRLDGRLQNAEYLSCNIRYPIILPRKNWITKLIVRYYHEQGNHSIGTNQTLSALSTRFWLIAGREEIRAWESECAGCRRRKAKAATQIMAPLPKIRLQMPIRAFAKIGVDYAGPFITIQGKGRRRQKRYLALFTCLDTRAVHLELAYSLDTDSFLNAFYRMVNRRGLPKEVISDNGSNFVGAERELRELVQQLNIDTMIASTANQGVKWTFNPPISPHFGGAFESMIKSAKKAIYAILGNSDVTDEELLSAMTGAESLINSRPLTYQSSNPQDDVPLTPNHFLTGQLGGEFAPESVDSTDFNPRKRWRRVQELVRHFWHRWFKEWLLQLNPRKKWFNTRRDFAINDVVLVLSADTPRAQWPLGRIVEVFPGPDGHVRVAKVQVGQKVFTRSISKLCPLEYKDKAITD